MLWVAALLVAGLGGVLGVPGDADVDDGQALAAGGARRATVLGEVAAGRRSRLRWWPPNRRRRLPRPARRARSARA